MKQEPISIASPVAPHELPKPMRAHMMRLAHKVLRRAAHDSVEGEDMILRVYMSGMYHGMILSKQLPAEKREEPYIP